MSDTKYPEELREEHRERVFNEYLKYKQRELEKEACKKLKKVIDNEIDY